MVLVGLVGLLGKGNDYRIEKRRIHGHAKSRHGVVEFHGVDGMGWDRHLRLRVFPRLLYG